MHEVVNEHYFPKDLKVSLQASSHGETCSNKLVGLTFSGNLVSLTQLTEVGAIFAFTHSDISCMLQVVTTNRMV